MVQTLFFHLIDVYVVWGRIKDSVKLKIDCISILLVSQNSHKDINYDQSTYSCQCHVSFLIKRFTISWDNFSIFS